MMVWNYVEAKTRNLEKRHLDNPGVSNNTAESINQKQNNYMEGPGSATIK